MLDQTPYRPTHKIRIVTAASLFDGHDAAINIMRRIMQFSGAEVIHLGHNRSVQEIVDCAIQEDVQAVAVSSYQGGHVEYFKYMRELLNEKGGTHIKIFGGGGGVILPDEIEALQNDGITRLFSPDDGREMGLQGMVNEVLQLSDFNPWDNFEQLDLLPRHTQPERIARIISILENNVPAASLVKSRLKEAVIDKAIPVIGITGTGGSGKSSLVDELVRRFLLDDPALKIGIISVDPSKRRTGGALLGDRIRTNSIHHSNVYMRSMATRGANLSLSGHVDDSIGILKAAGFDLIMLETSGIGQSDTQITDHCNMALYVMTPEFGAPSQLEKIDMLDFADFVLINKADKRGAQDALRDVKKQFQRNHMRWTEPVEEMPVYLTHASLCFDAGINGFYEDLCQKLQVDYPHRFTQKTAISFKSAAMNQLIPGERSRYLSEIAETVRQYNQQVEDQSLIAGKLYAIKETIHALRANTLVLETLQKQADDFENQLAPANLKLLNEWNDKRKRFSGDHYTFKVRHKEIQVETTFRSLSHLSIPKIALPRYKNWEDVLRWQLKENVPGEFPFAAGVFPFKREKEDPTRMFAGEGSPERTNKRFHYLAQDQNAIRLSTAFDSVTLYGENPDRRPDIFGKVGNSGVSVATLDDAKKLYSGFDLCASLTSVSMTINGPAPVMMAFFLNAAIDQQCEKYIRRKGLEDEVQAKIRQKYAHGERDRMTYVGRMPVGNDGLGLLLLGISGDEVLPCEVYAKIKKDTLSAVRGTVQADILKEDQAQNTCIFSSDFSLKLMGDVQAYFIDQNIRNFYSVSVSGYHIAEAGANPVTQLAFTLANGFTYVEYYLSRGMHIDDFAPNLSFFFSNGIDPEFSVIGRVARLIWAKAMKHKYGANERSQKLKYHIQTSGRSLHAQEIEFNDIRTTLQALYAIYDNCNSLHTNAYDEAITTPTEESVRRALAIQMIINHELGLAKNQNPLQGAFIIEELTDLVEEAVLKEFDRLNERGGVLGAMETNYQRSKIQDESLHYEHLKNKGDLPIIGVNTFLSKTGSPTILPREVIRSTMDEKQNQLSHLQIFHYVHQAEAQGALNKLKAAAMSGENLFTHLMETVKVCSLGQITQALYEVGGQYRRNM